MPTSDDGMGLHYCIDENWSFILVGLQQFWSIGTWPREIIVESENGAPDPVVQV
jgi:hypothetical protein